MKAPPLPPRGKPEFHLIKYSFVVLFSCSTILEAMGDFQVACQGPGSLMPGNMELSVF